MVKASRDFQVFVKPTGSKCNLDCHYCYYLEKEHLYPGGVSHRMPFETLEEYIVQHIEASPDQLIRFSWHGGEPTLLGLDYFRDIVALQNNHKPRDKIIINGIQTNGTLIDEDWCRFLSEENFTVGISLDGPPWIHDRHRVTRDRKPTHKLTMRGYRLLQKHKVPTDILCVVNSDSVKNPLEVYRFFSDIDAKYISFLPMVERQDNNGVDPLTVPAEAWGRFLCTIFDEWQQHDIGRLKVQIFEEATRVAFNQVHSLCIFRPTCGDIPVIEHNGDFYSCDHYVEPEHYLGNILETPLVELLERPEQIVFGEAKRDTLPDYCNECSVKSMCNGGCPKNRFINTPNGEPGLNYLCEGYKQFFTHIQPFISAVAELWKKQRKS